MAQTSQIFSVSSNLVHGLFQYNARYVFSVSRRGESPSVPSPTCFGAFEQCVGNPDFGDVTLKGWVIKSCYVRSRLMFEPNGSSSLWYGDTAAMDLNLKGGNHLSLQSVFIVC